MHIPLNTFYLLRVLFLEGEDKERGECSSIGDFAFGALLSAAVSRDDFLSLASEKKECVKAYRMASMLAKIVPPRLIANREFVIEEYLALRENVTPIAVETDFTDERVSFDGDSLAGLRSELDGLLQPHFQMSDKRAREGIPDDYWKDPPTGDY